MAVYYKGSEIKFSIALTAQGFSMDDDDFAIEVRGQKGSIKGNKNNTTGDSNIVIFREPALDDDSSSSEPSEGTWFAIISTDPLSTGDMDVIGTAYIPDSNAPDGIRTDLAKTTLGTLKNI